MTAFQDKAKVPDDFSGFVRVFPLPNLVMFPRVMQPLHIFEPRFVRLLEDALAGDRLIAVALLRPGWERDYDGRPPIEPVVCIGRISTHTIESAGRHSIFLAGLQRALVEFELPPIRPFRQAKVALLDDRYPVAGEAERGSLHKRLCSTFREMLPSTLAVRRQFEQLLNHSAPLGPLVDIIAFTIGLDLNQRQRLLAETNVDRRARLLLDLLSVKRRRNDGERLFPPNFSSN